MANSTGPLRIFLVDDSELIRTRVVAMLGMPSMTIVGQARTPQGAIDGILTTCPDVVVLDIQLDGGTGLDVLRAVHSVEPGIAFVVFSNNSSAAYRKRYLADGAVSFLDKSTESEQLAGAVANAPRQLAI